jgi:hypothetical protein
LALEGGLKEFSLEELLILLGRARKSGFLELKRGEVEGGIYFKEGKVYFARSEWNKSSMGVRLLRSKAINRNQLDEAMKVVQKGGGNLGEALISLGFVSQKFLEKFIKKEIINTVFDLFRWPEGKFHFYVDESSPEEHLGVVVEVETLLEEISKRRGEWERIKERIPSLKVVFQLAEAPGEGSRDILLKPREWKVLRLINGERDLETIVKMLGMNDFEVSKIVYGLYSVGLLEEVKGSRSSLV